MDARTQRWGWAWWLLASALLLLACATAYVFMQRGRSDPGVDDRLTPAHSGPKQPGRQGPLP